MDDNYEEEMDKFLKKIKDKFDDNPELKDEVEDIVVRLNEIFESDVDLNIKFDLNVEGYKEEIIKYDESEFTPANEGTMTVSEMVNVLENEEDLYLSIDPISLKNGVNDIHDVLVTSFNNKVIIVPVIEKK